MSNYEALKAAALAATPGPWYRSSVLFNGVTSEQAFMHQGNKPHIANAGEKRDATFIAAVSPDVVLSLLAALEEKDQRIAELERANAAQDDHINQQQDRIDTLEKKNADLGKYAGELEQRLQQPIKLRKCDIGIACEFISEHVVVSLAAVMVEAATAGFKVEVEGE